MVLKKGKIKLNLCTAAAQRTRTQSEACLLFYNSAGDGNLLTRWDVSSIPQTGFFSLKKIKRPNEWKTIKSLVHKIRLHGRRGKGMAESFSREKLRHASQKEGG